MTGHPTFPTMVVPRLEPEHIPPDRLTIAVFGPGHGEAILIGLPDGRLGVLDGCAEREDPVLALIGRIDRHRETPPRLAFVGMTHPHDDHFAGLGHLIESLFHRIDFLWDTPIGNRHAKALYEYDVRRQAGKGPLPDEWKVSALGGVVNQMTRAVRERNHGYRLLGAGKYLARLGVAGSPMKAQGVAPSDRDVYLAQLDLVGAIRALSEARKPQRGADPNYMSAAIVLRWGQAGVLLTGDLLNEHGGYLGWSDVDHDDLTQDGSIQVVKCAHHASVGAHHHGIWERLKPQLALVTPFKRASTEFIGTGADPRQRHYPPRPDHIGRIAAVCPVVITSRPHWPDSPSHPRPARGRTTQLALDGTEDTGAKTDALPLVPRAGRTALDNAVAVTLDATGEILQVVLAGEADFYAP